MDTKNDVKTRRGFGDTLKKARLGLKLTQAEVATKAGIHVNYYARIERGEENPTLDIIKSLTETLKIKSLNLWE